MSTEAELREELATLTRILAMRGLLELHGHVSVFDPESGRIYMCPGMGWDKANRRAADHFVFALDGRSLEGEGRPPLEWPIHTALHAARPDVLAIAHLHSPFATAFAVANRPIEGWTEAFGIFGLEDGVPLAAYGARGSDQAIDNIKSVLTPKTRAVLLANHGILCFHDTPAQTVQTNVIVEEAAQSAIYASALGGPKVVAPELLHASQERAASFIAAGARRG
jgi:L-fuculose-phosphate aldolase